LIISLAVSIQYTSVWDRQTARQTDRQTGRQTDKTDSPPVDR